jgi:DNA polymerase III epsilon subunit-like protein
MIETFWEVIQGGDFVVLDTETTGLGRDAEICSIAIIDAHGEALLDTLVKPVRGIPGDATRIHGITDADVASAPGYADVQPKIEQLLSGRDVLVYNATYDRKMLHQSAEAAGIAKTHWSVISRWHCVMIAFAPILGEWDKYHGSYRWQRLNVAAHYYGVTIEGWHGALADCQTTLAIIRAMRERKNAGE